MLLGRHGWEVPPPVLQLYTQPFVCRRRCLTYNYDQSDLKTRGEGFSFVFKLSDCSLSVGNKTRANHALAWITFSKTQGHRPHLHQRSQVLVSAL